MKTIYSILFIILCFMPLNALADIDSEKNIKDDTSLLAVANDSDFSGKSNDTPSNSEVMIKAFGGMTVIVLFILGLAWIAKRLNIQNLNGHKNMKVLEVLPLGTREKAIIIDVYGEHVLMGVAPGNVNYIKTLDPLKILEKQDKQEKNNTHSAWSNNNKTVDFAKKLNEFLSQGK